MWRLSLHVHGRLHLLLTGHWVKLQGWRQVLGERLQMLLATRCWEVRDMCSLPALTTVEGQHWCWIRAVEGKDWPGQHVGGVIEKSWPLWFVRVSCCRHFRGCGPESGVKTATV